MIPFKPSPKQNIMDLCLFFILKLIILFFCGNPVHCVVICIFCFRLNDNTVRFGEERNFQQGERDERRFGEGERFGEGDRFGEGEKFGNENSGERQDPEGRDM